MGFPEEFVLNGSDTFLVGLDAIYRKKSKQSNCCTLAVELRDALTQADLASTLESSAFFQWARSLRLKGHGPFKLMTWKSIRTPAKCTISLTQADSIFAIDRRAIPSHLDPSKQCPISFTLVELPHAHALLFTWHHGLMDAHGAETFLRTLDAPITDDPLVGTNAKGLSKDWKDHLTIREFLSEVSALPFCSPVQKDRVHGKTQYTVVRLSEEETRLSDARAVQAGAGANPSLFYLAICGQFIRDLLARKDMPSGDMLVPVPLDLRRRGSPYPVISNQLSFLFYRLKAQHAESVDATAKDLAGQLMNMLRMQFPKRYAGMMEMLRWVPLSIYPHVIASTTKGHIASFIYSDTGTSLDQLDTVLGRTVTHAVHYPPNLHPPGVTFVFSKIHGALQVTIGYREDYFSTEELKQATDEMRKRLTTPGQPADCKHA
jgi:NRPS condensation-like uncharacterized protein